MLEEYGKGRRNKQDEKHNTCSFSNGYSIVNSGVLCSSTGTTIVMVIIMSPINILGAFLLWAVLMAIGISIVIFYNYAKEMIRLKSKEVAIEEERREEERRRDPW